MAGLRNILIIISALLLSGACSVDERIGLPGTSGSRYAELSFTGDPLSKYRVPTKASDPKEEDEKRINQLYIFFFDADGEYLQGSYLEGYPGASESGGYYAPGQGVTTLKIANDAAGNHFNDPEKARSAIVYALANVDPAVLGLNELDANGRPANIKNMQELEEKFYSPYSSLNNSSSNENKLMLLSIPERGMPMAGKKTVDLTKIGNASENADERTIELKALMARVDVNIRLDCETDDVPGLPKLIMVEWTAVNMPTGVKIKEPSRTPEEYTVLGDGQKIDEITREQYRQITNRNGEISLSFYMFENVQAPDNTHAQDTVGIKDSEKQKYKPMLANENASAIRLHCNYATYNDQDGNATYDVYYTLYLGANHTDDFTVRRNRQYKNDITIAGLIQHDAVGGGDRYSFDARVNVDENNNKYHIAILRERNHDAHFCVTPMDVYLFADPSLNPQLTVTVEESAREWLGMERIPAENMEAGTALNDTQIATGTAWTAGNGKRKYFTMGLVDQLNNANQGEVTVAGNRDRVYFYLDENLVLENRQATVTLTYKDNETPESSRTFIIEQVHLLPVQIYETNDRDANGNFTSDWKHTIYMEQFEEYLNHYDPLDISYTPQIYPGLPWAQAGTSLENTTLEHLNKNNWNLLDRYDEPQLIKHDGFPYTAYVINITGQGDMTLNETPKSAFQYCWNKNVRNNDNRIPDGVHNNRFVGYYVSEGDIKGKWFLPGIRQMEQSLVTHYNTFSEFQGNYYWSCSAGEHSPGNYNAQNPRYARATKIDENSENIYVESGPENPYTGPYGDGGYALRTVSDIRIRAFRIDLNKPYTY